METVVIIIMALVAFSFLLKLTCHDWIGRFAMGAICAAFIILTYENATMQSKAQIAYWMAQPDLMLDMSVWLSIDVAFQIAFCILAAKSFNKKLSRTESILLKIFLWLPGILIFPVLFATLMQLIFTMTGTDFAVIAWSMAIGVLLLVPSLAFSVKWLIPEIDIRLELMFMINLLIAALGIVATVNGRTAAVGTNEVEWGALGTFILLTLVASLFGFIRFRKKKTSI